MTHVSVAETIRVFWDSPFPVTLQGEDFRFVDVNPAYLEFTGFPREAVIGVDPLDFEPPEDRERVLESRRRLLAGQPSNPFMERRLIDAAGRLKWFRSSRRSLVDEEGRKRYLAVLQDCTEEHLARERAEASLRELDLWFALSPAGMVLFDATGLVLRSNAAFESLVGAPPVSLQDAPLPLRELLGFGGDTPVDGEVRRHTARLSGPDGVERRLRGSVRRYDSAAGSPRLMAVVEDRSADDERDLARLQIGALMDAAGVGMALFRDSGWLREGQGLGESAPANLQKIGREVVEAASLPAYEELQVALRNGERAQVRYAIRHPEFGQRWLLTRVEPAELPSGQRTTSVVTLDITEQERSRARNEQLLAELSSILESTPAGIASLRGDRVVRCNGRFEALLGLPRGTVAGRRLEELFSLDSRARRVAAETLRSIADGAVSGETEIELPGREGSTWLSLSVRRTEADGADTMAVLSDVTRLKTQQIELESLAQAMQVQANRTRAVLDSVLVGIVVVDRDGIGWMNRSARRMFAGNLVEFVHQPIATVAGDDPDHPFRRTRYLEELAEGQAETFECRVKARDGREFWVVGNVVATGDGRGGRQLTYALLDIERRRQAEARMSQAQASLQRVIEAAPLAITLRDAKTLRILQTNAVAAASVDRNADDLIGRSPEEIFEPEIAIELRADMEAALRSAEVTVREYRWPDARGMQRVWDSRYLPIASSPEGPPDQLLLVATDVTDQRAAQEARFAAAIAQREMLVKEVHHRIKNNLQGVAGLLQQIAQRKPDMAATISEVVGQVQAIAQVYGLQVGAVGPLRVKNVVEAITVSLGRTFGREVRFDLSGPAAHDWALPESESIPIALAINELLTNAIKHGSDAVHCRLECDRAGARLAISSAAQLPSDFRLEAYPGGVSGLGLVRSLLPRRAATLAIEQRGGQVVATVTLSPPAIAWLDAA